jgi:hypothetical protein
MIKIIYLFFASIVSLNALAWNPFSSHNDNEEIPLSSEELKKVQENAGWTKDDDKTLIFEVHNDLKAPIACSGAQVELNEGKHMSKAFTPKLFVPAGNSRLASFAGIAKGTMKSYAVICSCFKKQGKGECINPLAKPAI